MTQPSSPPEPIDPGRWAPRRGGPRRGSTVGAALVGVVAALALTLSMAISPAAGADELTQDGGPTTTLEREPLPGQAPTGAECGPGNIVRHPDCGREPVDAGDPGGSLQVTLFFLVCAAVVGMAAAVWWRARRARARRRAAGLDPLELARARGEGVRKPRA